MKNPTPQEFRYTLTLDNSGIVTLTQGDEELWESANDAAFIDRFGDEVVESGDLDDVAAWLEEHNYLPPRVDLDIVDETADDDEDTGVGNGRGEDYTDDEPGEIDEDFSDPDSRKD